MKKIFAIALALVMVLSMASAFAFVGTCGKYEWTCDTAKCGVAKAEVVQFVANNTIDRYEESACAAVVVGRALNWGIKVTFDKDVNPQWFYHKNTKLVFETSNVQGAGKTELVLSNVAGNKGPADVSGKTYWLRYANGTYDLVSDWEPACVFGALALTTRANVTAKVGYDFNGVTVNPSNLDYFKNPDNLSIEWIDYGDFKVRVHKNYGGKVEYAITVKKGGDVYTVWVIDGVAKYASETNAADADAIGVATASSAAQAGATAAVTTAQTALNTAKAAYDAQLAVVKPLEKALNDAKADEAAAKKALDEAIARRDLLAAKPTGQLTVDEYNELTTLNGTTDVAGAIGTAGANETNTFNGKLDTAKVATTAAQTLLDAEVSGNPAAGGKNLNTLQRELDAAQAAYDIAMAGQAGMAAKPVKFYNKFDGTYFSGVNGYLDVASGKIIGTPTSTDSCNTLANLLQMINIKLGDCVKGSTIKAIFGWEDSASSKATWNKDAVAIANAQCQVAIPKTGDASVVAYAVMALVAAAGAMGLKK